jgi:hypothetical protein
MQHSTDISFYILQDCLDAWKFWERRPPLSRPEDLLRTPPNDDEEADGSHSVEKSFEVDAIKVQGSSVA